MQIELKFIKSSQQRLTLIFEEYENKAKPLLISRGGFILYTSNQK